MDNENLRLIRNFDYRLRVIERNLQELDRFNKRLFRFLTTLEQKLGSFDGKFDEAMDQMNAQYDKTSPVMRELEGYSE